MAKSKKTATTEPRGKAETSGREAALQRVIAEKLGYNPIAFAIVGILAIEAGLLTPPFGLLVYTVKAAVQDEDDSISIVDIFKSSTPFWVIILIAMIFIIVFPKIATVLPDLVF